MVGALWALGAAVCFSLGHVALSRGVARLGAPFATVVMLVAGAVVVALAAVAIDGPSVLMASTGAGVLFFMGAGLVHFIGGWGFMNASTRLIGPSRMSAITGATPLFAAVFAVVLLHEDVNWFLGLGILAIVAGTYFIATS
jgi:drug/metabolite transporter (DMT)-like permease